MMKLEYIFSKCLDISMSKRQDYTSNSYADPHENFKRSAHIASWFSERRDKPYAVLIATKLARLASLLSDDRMPNNESIDDTFLDLINYCALWAEVRTTDRIKDEAPKESNQRFAGGEAGLGKSYTESVSKPANFSGPEESNMMKIIKLSNGLTAGDIAALRDYFKRMDHDKNYREVDKY